MAHFKVQTKDKKITEDDKPRDHRLLSFNWFHDKSRISKVHNFDIPTNIYIDHSYVIR